MLVRFSEIFDHVFNYCLNIFMLCGFLILENHSFLPPPFLILENHRFLLSLFVKGRGNQDFKQDMLVGGGGGGVGGSEISVEGTKMGAFNVLW